MKATIHGVIVDGTPQEIVEYQKRMQAPDVLLMKPASDKLRTMIMPIATNSMLDYPSGKCPNEGKSCYCTGQCNK